MVSVSRFWKDPEFRGSLSPDELAALPANPVGVVDISERDLDGAHGLGTDWTVTTGCCQHDTHIPTCAATCNYYECNPTASVCHSYCLGAC
jgi:mersacidin/lichenicidin family type 2 lantibiotic